jgi:hypothetical protein
MNTDPILMNLVDFLTDHMAQHTRVSKVEIYHPEKKEPLSNGHVIVKTIGHHNKKKEVIPSHAYFILYREKFSRHKDLKHYK